MRTLLVAVVTAAIVVPTAVGNTTPPDWDAIASYYAQRPVTVRYSDTTSSAYTDGFGNIVLGMTAKRSLDYLAAHAHDIDMGPGLGTLGLGTLIHEALHNRDFHTPNMWDDNSRNPVTGYYSAGNECQAGIMGYELVGNAMYRFFNVQFGTALSLRYVSTARKLGEPWRNRCASPPILLLR